MTRDTGGVRRWAITSSLAFLIAGAGPAHAQLTYGADVMLRPRYEWRGLTRTSNPVLQPDVYGAAGRTVMLTVGAWTSYGLVAIDRGAIGIGRGWFRETALWTELSVEPVAGLDLAAGWTATLAGVDSSRLNLPRVTDTHELYGRLRVRFFRLVPEVTLFHDVDAAHGTYLEAGLDLHLPVWTRVVLPVGDLVLGARLGASWGLDPSRTDPDEFWYFARDGITHLEFGARTALGPFLPFDGPTVFAIHLAWRLEHNVDDVARAIGPGDSAEWHHWFEIGVSLWGPRCRPSRGICS